MLKRAAIIYICTGAYIEYWHDFFDSFEDNFLENYEKHYYVFTDAQEVYMNNNERVHVHYQAHLPWPLIALMKFHISLQIKDELIKYDFVYISNANIVCKAKILEEDILPNKDEGQRYSFTLHPGYFYDKRYTHKCYTEYERNKASLAYIPYNVGEFYVYGNMWGGMGVDFVELLEDLDYRIGEDLKKRIIPVWHDESYVNRYTATHNDFRLLNPGYCYPVGFDVDFEKKIVGVPKVTVFDVNNFKGYYEKTEKYNVSVYFGVLYKRTIKRWGPFLHYVWDRLLNKKPAE